MSKELKFILWICDEMPKNSYQIQAGLQKEGVFLSYPSVMNRIGLLIAQEKLRKIRRMDQMIVYQTIYEEIPKEELK